MNALEAFNVGSLEEALEISKQEVKSNPTDVAKRNTFCEMLCWSGDLERADKQLDTLMMQDPSAAMGLALFRQLIRAEMSRQECFQKGRAPELLHEVDEVTRLQIDLLLCMREGQAARALELVAEIDEKRPKVVGTCDGEAFDDIRDLDDSCATFAEVLTSTGKYYWVPFEKIDLISLQPIERPRDLLWRRAHMIVRGGPDGEVYLPLNYAKSLGSDDKQLCLGRATDWTGGEDEPVQGLGRRLWLIGENDKTLLQVEDFVFGVDSGVESGGATAAAPAESNDAGGDESAE